MDGALQGVARGEVAAGGELRSSEGGSFDRPALAALGRVAVEMAHELNNVLSAVRGFAAALESHIPPDATAHLAYRELVRTCERGSSITRKVFEFSHEAAPPQPVDLASFLRGAHPLLRHVLPDRILLVYSVADGLPPVHARPNDLELVLLNLVVNARDAIEGCGSIEIGAARAPETEGPDTVLLTVRDSGTGMDPDVLDRVFEPFFTTKPPGGGAGLGLAIAREVLRACGASIEIESAAEHGTVVTIRLRTALQPATVGERVLLCMLPGPTRDRVASTMRCGGFEVVALDRVAELRTQGVQHSSAAVVAVSSEVPDFVDWGWGRLLQERDGARPFMVVTTSAGLSASWHSPERPCGSPLHVLPGEVDPGELLAQVERLSEGIAGGDRRALH
jgi:anti-sigma regulatory factor (Ser/Thr protein kinase)